MSELEPTRTYSNLTATERIRAMLDERGVEYRVSATGYSIEIGPSMTAYANRTDTTLDVSLLGVTPEQAIAATLGDADATGERQGDAGTCHMELTDLRGHAYTDVYVCSECGGEVMVGTVMGESDVPKWCPWCGRKVVDA